MLVFISGLVLQLVSVFPQLPDAPRQYRPARVERLIARHEAAVGAQSAGTVTPRPHLRAVHAPRPPDIDGRLDDLIWRSAAAITRFSQRSPIEGAPATEDTDVRIAFDEDYLYVGIHAHYTRTGLIRANRVDRDQTGSDDRVLVFLDPFLDRQRGYVFSVNGYGVQADSLMSTGDDGTGDASWDALFSSAGRLVDDGWTAEMAIPFKSLRYPTRAPGQEHRWGLQVQREIQSKNETVVWAPVSRNVMGFLSQMGTLDGLVDLSTSRNLEMQPTLTAIRANGIDEVSGRYEPIDLHPQAGVGIKYGVTSNITIDFTANPDFSQIESDEAQVEVNRRYPTFHDERRPFFLAGQEIFSVQGPVTLLHTRTIVDPRLGAKVTGKHGRTSFGVLFADDAAPGSVNDSGGAAGDGTASVFIGRARYELYPESFIGAIATDRELANDDSRLGGVDGRLQLGQQHRLGFRVMMSDRRDPEGVRRSGPMFDVGFRREGRGLSYGISHFEIDPDFGTDVGFVRRTDTRKTDMDMRYRWWPEGALQNWSPHVSYSRNYDYAGMLQDEELDAAVNFDFARNISLDGGARRSMERYLGVPFDKTRVSAGGRVNSSRRLSFGVSMNIGDQIRYIDTPFLGRARNINAFVTLRPVPRLRSRIDLDMSRLTDPRNDSEVYAVHILRAQTTYQFTDRLFVRNITDFNSYQETFGTNILVTYRVNAGTAFFAGYDDRRQQGDRIAGGHFPTGDYRPTNRAVFMKLQYLLRL